MFQNAFNPNQIGSNFLCGSEQLVEFWDNTETRGNFDFHVTYMSSPKEFRDSNNVYLGVGLDSCSYNSELVQDPDMV
jgi:hypothetical protein